MINTPPINWKWKPFEKKDVRCQIQKNVTGKVNVTGTREPCGEFVPTNDPVVQVNPYWDRVVPYNPLFPNSWQRVCRRVPEKDTGGSSNFGEPDIPGQCLKPCLPNRGKCFKGGDVFTNCPFANVGDDFDPADPENALTKKWDAAGFAAPSKVICERVHTCDINRQQVCTKGRGGLQCVVQGSRGRCLKTIVVVQEICGLVGCLCFNNGNCYSQLYQARGPPSGYQRWGANKR